MELDKESAERSRNTGGIRERRTRGSVKASEATARVFPCKLGVLTRSVPRVSTAADCSSPRASPVGRARSGFDFDAQAKPVGLAATFPQPCIARRPSALFVVLLAAQPAYVVRAQRWQRGKQRIRPASGPSQATCQWRGKRDPFEATLEAWKQLGQLAA